MRERRRNASLVATPIVELKARENADFMTAHDPEAFRTFRKGPDCYE
jgi:hypothetical protein